MEKPKAIIRRSKMSEEIANILEEEILSEGRPGERLGSEQQLCERFDASRTVIREALKLLHARGLIQSRTGSGAYIVRPDVKDLSQMIARIIRMDGISYRSVFDVRYYLEAAAARRLAEHGTEEDFRALEEILQKLRSRELTVIERRDLDYSFHESIAQRSGNPLLALLVETMAYVFKDVIKTGIFVAGGIDDAIIRHQRIMDALRERDAAKAERMVWEHLDQSRQNYEVYHEIK